MLKIIILYLCHMKKSFISNISGSNWIYLIIILFLFPLVFFKLFSTGFMCWDDAEYILENQYVHTLSVRDYFTRFYIGNYHPLTMFSFAIDWQLFGNQAKGYHIENIVWHLFNSILVFYIGKRFSLTSFYAFILASIFAFHPLQIETVAWISERKNLLYAFFFLSAIFFYLKYKLSHKFLQLFLVYLLFVFSLLSKSSAVTLPLVFVLIDVFIFNENWKKNIKRYIPLFFISITFGVVNLISQSSGKFISSSHSYPLFDKIGIFGYGIFHYIASFIFPGNLSVFYSYPANLNTISIIGIITLIFLIAVIYFIVKNKKWHTMFSVSFFLVNIFLVLQIIPFGDAITADRYMYIPIIGLSLLLIYLFIKLEINKMFLVLLIMVLPFLSVLRASLWEDNILLLKNSLKKNPTSIIPLNSIGVIYMERNDFKNAFNYLNKTINYSPNYYKGYYNRGLLNGKIGNYKNAISDFSKAIELTDYYKAYVGRGNSYLMLKDYSKAFSDAEKANSLNKNNPRTLFLLANCYDDLNQFEKAILYYNEAIDLNTENPSYYLRRAIVYGKMQQFQLCLKDLDICTELDKNYAEAYYWKGVVKVNLKQNPCSDLKRAVDLGFEAAQQPLANYCK